ncbi:SDR family oxidoreductase [Pseudomonas sp. GD03842]|uniref:SDR family oxidoreductase n=1 Tax=unclassified Pseudomonas TaxID=196821 RepID=UPI000D37FA0C|nr:MULTISPECIES: SDR family oxidoreductase [unclassified Pseudomonas]MDH0744754.1 SDR family oxidoreductase [Pseudomonas sp. GD03842]RAU45504.1 short-chain dehydrogenase [Pseudomonas sp. RIT 409]RAU53112.1 short-chain dehydrogenase [Pseudomonas sp. RIT 412]
MTLPTAKKILIIGATSAIATACARLWASQGSDFFLVARNVDKLQQTAADLKARGAKNVTLHEMDATDIDAHPLMLSRGLTALGQIDIALIAHGTLPDQKACERDVQLAMREFANNGTSVIALLTILAQQFETQRCGSLAIISSVAADRGRPSNYLYGSAKAAVSTYCEGLQARLFKVGVHVTTIKPGFVDTPMTQGLSLPAALLAQPAQVAQRIVNGIAQKAPTLYAPGFWALIMLIIRSIPQPVFKRLNL